MDQSRNTDSKRIIFFNDTKYPVLVHGSSNAYCCFGGEKAAKVKMKGKKRKILLLPSSHNTEFPFFSKKNSLGEMIQIIIIY